MIIDTISICEIINGKILEIPLDFTEFVPNCTPVSVPKCIIQLYFIQIRLSFSDVFI